MSRGGALTRFLGAPVSQSFILKLVYSENYGLAVLLAHLLDEEFAETRTTHIVDRVGVVFYYQLQVATGQFLGELLFRGRES